MVSCSDLDPGQFNLIAAGCGAGKTYWIINHFMEHVKDTIVPAEVLFVTSRSIIKEQQSKTKGTTKLRRKDTFIRGYWNGLGGDESVLDGYGISIATYDQLVDMINNSTGTDHEVLKNVKALVLDECHVMFSDTFISDIAALRVWIRDNVNKRQRLLIGLSATTQIIDAYEKAWGTPINRVSKEAITGYQAKQLVCTDFDTIPYLISANKLLGKTIIMCPSIKCCNDLASKINNSTVVVSAHAKKAFTKEMSRIRDYIAKEEELPPTYFDAEGNEHELHVLICTSTLREGFNLKESSGVRNVITCFSDELHVTQFAGRCRYDIDNLVVAKRTLFGDNLRPNSYLVYSRRFFNEFMADKNCVAWFDTISHLVQHDVYAVKKFILGTEDVRFVNYINERWLVPKGTRKKDTQRYRIWREEDKEEIVQMAIRCKMFSQQPSYITFMKVIRILTDTLGYDIKQSNTVIDGSRQRFKLIVDYDENKNEYEQAIPTIDE